MPMLRAKRTWPLPGMALFPPGIPVARRKIFQGQAGCKIQTLTLLDRVSRNAASSKMDRPAMPPSSGTAWSTPPSEVGPDMACYFKGFSIR